MYDLRIRLCCREAARYFHSIVLFVAAKVVHPKPRHSSSIERKHSALEARHSFTS